MLFFNNTDLDNGGSAIAGDPLKEKTSATVIGGADDVTNTAALKFEIANGVPSITITAAATAGEAYAVKASSNQYFVAICTNALGAVAYDQWTLKLVTLPATRGVFLQTLRF